MSGKTKNVRSSLDSAFDDAADKAKVKRVRKESEFKIMLDDEDDEDQGKQDNMYDWDLEKDGIFHVLMFMQRNQISQFLTITSMYLNNENQEGFPPIGEWDVLGVTDMQHAFRGYEQFNENINAWNVSSVTNMFFMFAGCKQLNQPFDNWNTSKVTNMSHMFFNCASLNTSARLNCSSCETLLRACENCTSLTYPLFDEETFGSVFTQSMYKNTKITMSFPKTVALQIMLHGGFQNKTFVLPNNSTLVRITSKDCGELLEVFVVDDWRLRQDKFRFYRFVEPSTNFFYKLMQDKYNEIDNSSSLDELKAIFNCAGPMPNLVKTKDYARVIFNESNQLTHMKTNLQLECDSTNEGKTNLRVNFFKGGDIILNKFYSYNSYAEEIIPSVFLLFSGVPGEGQEPDTKDVRGYFTVERLKSLMHLDILQNLAQFGVLELSSDSMYETSLRDILLFLIQRCGIEKCVLLDSACSVFMDPSFKTQHKAEQFPFQRHPPSHLEELQRKYPNVRHSPYINLGGQAKRRTRHKTRHTKKNKWNRHKAQKTKRRTKRKTIRDYLI